MKTAFLFSMVAFPILSSVSNNAWAEGAGNLDQYLINTYNSICNPNSDLFKDPRASELKQGLWPYFKKVSTNSAHDHGALNPKEACVFIQAIQPQLEVSGCNIGEDVKTDVPKAIQFCSELMKTR